MTCRHKWESYSTKELAWELCPKCGDARKFESKDGQRRCFRLDGVELQRVRQLAFAATKRRVEKGLKDCARLLASANKKMLAWKSWHEGANEWKQAQLTQIGLARELAWWENLSWVQQNEPLKRK